MLFTHYRIGTCRLPNIPTSRSHLAVGPPALCLLFNLSVFSSYSISIQFNLLLSIHLFLSFFGFKPSHVLRCRRLPSPFFLNMMSLDRTCQRPSVEWFGGSVGPARSSVMGTHGGSLPAVSPYTQWLLCSCGNEPRPSSL